VKADKILENAAWLKDEKGISVDGVGFQSHETMSWPSTADLETAIGKFENAGYKVKISELDVTVYDDYSTGSFVPSPQVEFTPELAQKQAKRFADLFALYRKKKARSAASPSGACPTTQTWLDNRPGAESQRLSLALRRRPRAQSRPRRDHEFLSCPGLPAWSECRSQRVVTAPDVERAIHTVSAWSRRG